MAVLADLRAVYLVRAWVGARQVLGAGRFVYEEALPRNSCR